MKQSCVEKLKIGILVTDNIVLAFIAYIIPIDNSSLPQLDLLRQQLKFADFNNETLFSTFDNWKAKFVNKMRENGIDCPLSVLFTETELS